MWAWDGVELEQHAQIAAAIAERAESVDVVLARHGMTAAQWDEITAHWTGEIAAEAWREGETPIANAYDDAFVRAQDALKPVPEMTVENWVRLEIAVAKDSRTLDARHLSPTDWLRLRRHWARAVGTDRGLAKQYAAARAALDQI